MPIKAILLDFDGTISDAKKIAYDSLIQTLQEYNYTFDKREAKKLLGIKMQYILKELGIKTHHLQRIRKTFYTHITQKVLSGGIKLCVPISPLRQLQRQGIPLIIISNSEQNFLHTSIKKLKLGKLFKDVYGAEKFSKKDTLLKKLFKQMKIKPTEAIYVGDRFSDVKFARSAGCIAVAIHNSCAWSTLAEIKKEKPDYIIKNFKELKKLIK